MKKLSFIMLIFVMMAGMLMAAIGTAEGNTTEFKVDYYEKVESLGSGDFSQPLKDGNFCAIKQGSGHVIVWSEDALSAEEQAEIEQVVTAKDPSTVGAEFHFTTVTEIDGQEDESFSDFAHTKNAWESQAFTYLPYVLIIIYLLAIRHLWLSTSWRTKHLLLLNLIKSQKALVPLD